jgi:hypothetical protein
MSQKRGRAETPKKSSQEPSKKKTKEESNIHYYKNVGYSRADLEDMDIKDFNEILEYKKLLCCKNIVPPAYRFEQYTNPDEPELTQTVCGFVHTLIYLDYFTLINKYILIHKYNISAFTITPTYYSGNGKFYFLFFFVSPTLPNNRWHNCVVAGAPSFPLARLRSRWRTFVTAGALVFA